MNDSAVPSRSAPITPKLSELFVGFLEISMSGFGGVLPWARRMLVERRGWLNEREFAEALALCAFLPGPNVANLSVIIGSRFRGVAGALAAFAGLVIAPLLILIVCGEIYSRFGDLETLRGALSGLAAGAAGLLIAMVIKMTAPLASERDIASLLFALATFILVGLLRVPLYWAILAIAPINIAWCWWRSR